MVAVGVVVVVVAKVLVWDAAIIDMVMVVEVSAIGVMTDVEIIVIGVVVIVLKFALPVPYSVDVPSGVAVDLFMASSPGVMLGVRAGIGTEVLADVNANAFTAAMTALEFPVPSPLEECSR